MFDSNFNLKIKNKIIKSDIIKLSDINYTENLAFNRKCYTYLKISFKMLFL
jgi:hypothetical protein